jgi:hypothetical protein
VPEPRGERGDERTSESEESEEGAVVAGVVKTASTFEAKKAAAEQAVTSATDEERLEIAAEVVKQLSRKEQTDLMTQLEALRPEQRKVVTEAAARTLPAEYQKELSFSLAPTQPVTDWIWRVIVGAFAIVFVLAVLSLCVAVVLPAFLPNPSGASELQTLLTVVTTVAGILAGFISGRASTGGTPS